jgi:quercetin 2,3-dioxygenase
MGRLGFGQLWALNEALLAPGKGMPLHAHENMEIISIPLAGTLRHQDSRGVSHTIAPGDIHVLSAGLGITHWEYNNSTQESAHYLQLWISPKSRMTPTHYAQATLAEGSTTNHFRLVVAPAEASGLVEINQDAFISLARLEPGTTLGHTKYLNTNGVYVFVIEGRITVGIDELLGGDGLGLTESALPAFHALEQSTVLCIEVPL